RRPRALAGPAEERRADRRARERRAPRREVHARLVERDPDPGAEAPEDTARAAGQRVAGPQVDRYAQRPRRDHDRERDRAAARAAHAWTEERDAQQRVEIGERQADERSQERETRFRVAQRAERQRMEWDARLGHEPILEPATTADEEEPHLGIGLAQRFGDREQRAGVTARPAADEEHATRSRVRARPRVQHSAGYPPR